MSIENKEVYEAGFREVNKEEIVEGPITDKDNLNTIKNASLNIDAVLGSKKLTIAEIMKMKVDDVIVLEKTVDEPITLMSNGKKIAEVETTPNTNNKLTVEVFNI